MQEKACHTMYRKEEICIDDDYSPRPMAQPATKISLD